MITTKDLILQAGLELMNQFGYGSLTLSELARQANITKQRIYYHFQSTEDVLVLLAEEWSQTGQSCSIEALAVTHEVGANKVLAISEGMFQWMKKYSELSRLGLVIYQSSPHIQRLSQFMETARKTARERIRSILVQDKVFSNMGKTEIEKVITAVHSLMYGFYFYIITMNDFKNLVTHQENCNQALKRLIASY